MPSPRVAEAAGQPVAEETLCSEQGRWAGRSWRPARESEATKRAGAALFSAFRCALRSHAGSERLRERRGHGTGRLKRLGIGNWKCTCEHTPTFRGFGPMGRDGGTQPMRPNLDGRRHPAAAAESSCLNTPAYTAPHAPIGNDISIYRGVKTPIFWRPKNGQPSTTRREAEAGRRHGQYLHWRCRCRCSSS